MVKNMGTNRTTFVIDENGIIVHIIKKLTLKFNCTNP